MGTEPAGPLLTLAAKLRSAQPPSLATLIALLEPAQSYGEFARLVREYLPERELEILRELDPAAQIAAFASHFQDRYFPLQDEFRGMVDDYLDLVAGIPVVALGISWDDYHEIPDWRLGLQLMTYVLESPYEADEGSRLVLAEALVKEVPAELLRRVPAGGRQGEAASRLAGTKYEGLARWAEILNSDSGNGILDTSMEDLWDMGPPEWDRETVATFTREWQQAEAIRDVYSRLAQWLEEAPAEHFKQLLDFIWPETEAGPQTVR